MRRAARGAGSAGPRSPGASDSDEAALRALEGLRSSRPRGELPPSGAPAHPTRPEIDSYVTFLRTAPVQRPVDYVLGLFRARDIVVLCERDHRDISQYDLFYDLVSDGRFLAQAACVFTEVGSRTMNAAVDGFLRTQGLPPEEVSRRLIDIYRDFSWQGCWRKYNYLDFLRRLYGLNASLEDDRKLTVHFCDLPVSWDGMTNARYRAEVRSLEADRDRLMAEEILATIDALDHGAGQRRKYLVIMNYRHAFTAFPGAGNTADYLYRRYPERTANVMLNSLKPLPGSGDQSDARAPVQNGKWDAAFAALGNPDLGFDLAGSPFGADHFDYFDFFAHDKRYQDVFTGYVFYRPLEEHLLMVGIPGLLDEEFLPTFLRRARIASGYSPSPLLPRRRIFREFNALHASAYPGLARYQAAIGRWLD